MVSCYVDCIVDIPKKIEVNGVKFHLDDDCDPPTYFDEDGENELMDIKDGAIRVNVDRDDNWFEFDAARENPQETVKRAIEYAMKYYEV